MDEINVEAEPQRLRDSQQPIRSRDRERSAHGVFVVAKPEAGDLSLVETREPGLQSA